MLIIASTCGVTNRQTQLTFKVLTTWQHPREGGVFGPVLWTNWEHWASMSTKLPPHWAETLWSPKNRAPTASNHAKTSAWVLVLAISLGRCILYLKVWFWIWLWHAWLSSYIYIEREGQRAGWEEIGLSAITFLLAHVYLPFQDCMNIEARWQMEINMLGW
jgi:hypothetical protein